MKKATKRLLSVGLCAALALSVGCGLAACGGDDGKTDPTPTAVPYWLAGTIKATPEWDNVTDANRFSATDNANIFEIKLDMWKGDTFKVRYEGKEWSQFQLNWDNSYDATQKADEDAKIGPDTTSITGQYNYLVKEEGNYTIKLDVSGVDPVVSYVYNGEATEKAPKQITKITLSESEHQLEVGQSFKLTATIEPADADDPSVEWYSSEEDYATVDAEGNVTAVAAGETTITVCSAADEEVLATCVVTVVEAGQLVAVESIALNKTETTLHAGGNETLTATVTPANATGSVAYTSSDDEVATVDATTGKITALKPGTATITASQGGKTATCEVTVVADYCLVGQSKSAAFEEKAWVAGYAGVSKVPTGILFTQDEEDATKYSIEVDLYEGDEFKIITAGLPGGWNAVDVLGASEEAEGVKLVDTATTETSISCLKSSASKNIGVANDGKYLITFTLPAEGDPTLTYKYLGPAAALVETEKDIYIKGNITSLNQTDWKHNFDATYKLAYDSEKKEYSIELVVTDEDAAKEFGFAQYGHTDDHSGDDVTGGAWIGRDNLGTDGDANDKFGDSGNYKGATPGTYKIVIKNVDGSWVVNFYAVTAQA